MFDFERLVIWRKPRLFRSPKDVLLVVPKELHLQTLLEFYVDNAGAFPSFINYIEFLGGRVATPEDLPIFDLEEVRPRHARAWLEDGPAAWQAQAIDTKKIGIKPFVPIEETIAENERKLRNASEN